MARKTAATKRHAEHARYLSCCCCARCPMPATSRKSTLILLMCCTFSASRPPMTEFASSKTTNTAAEGAAAHARFGACVIILEVAGGVLWRCRRRPMAVRAARERLPPQRTRVVAWPEAQQ